MKRFYCTFSSILEFTFLYSYSIVIGLIGCLFLTTSLFALLSITHVLNDASSKFQILFYLISFISILIFFIVKNAEYIISNFLQILISVLLKNKLIDKTADTGFECKKSIKEFILVNSIFFAGIVALTSAMIFGVSTQQKAMGKMIKGITFNKFVHLGYGELYTNVGNNLKLLNFDYIENTHKIDLKVLPDRDTSLTIKQNVSALRNDQQFINLGFNQREKSIYHQLSVKVEDVDIQRYYFQNRYQIYDCGHLYYLTLRNNHELILVGFGGKSSGFDWYLFGNDGNDIIVGLTFLNNNAQKFLQQTDIPSIKRHGH
ncbi:MAG: hypothetical protein ACOVO1_05300 [Chitinophagaceae bacterium]